MTQSGAVLKDGDARGADGPCLSVTSLKDGSPACKALEQSCVSASAGRGKPCYERG